MNHFIFAYGTLLVPAVQQAVIERQLAGIPDRLAGFRKTTLKDRETMYPNLAPDPEGRVDGCVLEVTQRELGRIDLYEGGLYTRHRVTTENTREVWVYYA